MPWWSGVTRTLRGPGRLSVIRNGGRLGTALPALTRPVGASRAPLGCKRPDHRSGPFGVRGTLNRRLSGVSAPSHRGCGLAEGIRTLL